MVRDPHTETLRELEYLSPYTAPKTLGHYKEPAGGQHEQCEQLKKKSDSITEFLWKTPLTRAEAWTYYSACCVPKRNACFHYDENSPKQQNVSHKTTDIVGKVHGTAENGILVRILLDTGASSTIILMDAIWGLNGPALKEQTTMWNTVGGQFVTNLQCEVTFTLPEFSPSKIKHWVCHVDTKTLRKNAQYDMIIIGADLLSE